MADTPDTPIRFLANPQRDRTRAYGEAERAILSRAGFDEAWSRIARWPGYAPTPLRELSDFARRAGVTQILYKDEGLRFTLKSFKALGGAYAVERLVDADEGDKSAITVTCATDGNHGRAVAWGAKRAGIRAVIYVHQAVSVARVRAIEALGAEIRRVAGGYDDSVRQCAADAAESGWQIVSDTSWEGYEDVPKLVMQGYGVLMDEAAEQGAKPTHVFVQAGVGGLAAAVLAWFWQKHGTARPQLVVVEPANAACLFESARRGEWAALEGDVSTVMAGLECGEPSRLAWRLLAPGADAFMTIPDECAEKAMRDLAAAAIVGGESGVAGLAGAMAAAADPAIRQALGLADTSRILVFGTEGATDPVVYARIVGKSAEAVAAGGAS